MREQATTLNPGEVILAFGVPMFKAQSQIEKLAKRAKRLGLAAPRLIELGAVSWRYCIEPGSYGRKPVFEVANGMVVRVEGERPVLPGHKLLGTVEPVALADGTVEYLVFASPDGQGRELSQYAGKGCDHCHTLRNRKLLVLVEHESGKVLRVGRECVQAYLPGVSVEQIVEYAQYARALDNVGGDLDEMGRGYGHDDGLFVHDYLSLCFAAVRVDGSYKPAALAENSTRAVVDFMEYTRRDRKASPQARAEAEKYRPTEEDRLLADAAIAWARALVPSSDFERNVNLAARADVLNPRRKGLVAAIVPSFNRELVKRSEKKAAPVTEYVGTVGKREVFKNVLCRTAYEIETDYGPSVIYVFADDAGHVFKWKASGKGHCQKGYRYDLKGSVKAHEEYKGTKQTVLTRCKVEAEYEPAEVAAAREAREKAEAERGERIKAAAAEYLAARVECGCEKLQLNAWEHGHSERCSAAFKAIQEVR